ncbi:hypothetical protein KIN20_013570 [Parelaphostrongylus tenuis]|uniref:Uncharacterized protein n=1 Tax=Parelaphostrongylus tenuis TaxID=148309 RepID=A0AAD5MYB1_PARTN|nr:hypothetical protein KIN20_013570 [Parelaphostrongylus tenuis]
MSDSSSRKPGHGSIAESIPRKQHREVLKTPSQEQGRRAGLLPVVASATVNQPTVRTDRRALQCPDTVANPSATNMPMGDRESYHQLSSKILAFSEIRYGLSSLHCAKMTSKYYVTIMNRGCVVISNTVSGTCRKMNANMMCMYQAAV